MPPEASTPFDHRQRILQALADVLMDKAYSEVTIADIAAFARISKRTFYEHFESKSVCLLALCEHTSERIMAVILNAYQPNMNWPSIVHEVTHAYLQAIEEAPVLMHALYMQLLATGRPGLDIRRAIVQRFADFLCGQVDMLRSQGESLKALDRPTAVAVIAGINELILQIMMDGNKQRITQLSEVAKGLVHAVTRPE
jgi:AcrR family transcriptional regulator